MFIALPIVTVAAYSAATVLVAPGTSAAYGLVSHKSGSHHLTHSADLVVGGQSIHQQMPFFEYQYSRQALVGDVVY